jgi:two-component system NarL family sensor kinase
MKKYYRLVLILLLTCLQAHSQQAGKIDSLKRALSVAREDTLRVAILSEISFAYANNSLDTAMIYLQQQMKIADRINRPLYTANVYNDLAILQYYKGDFTDAVINNKKALALREELGDSQLIASSLNKIATCYQQLGNNDEALALQLRVLKIAEQLGNLHYQGIVLNSLSLLSQKVNKLNDALLFGKRSLRLTMQTKDTLIIATALTSVETIFELQGKLDSAYEYQAHAIALLEQIGAKAELATAYSEMGYLLRIQKKDRDGLRYYRKALDLASQLGNTSDLAFYNGNIGSTYQDLGKIDSSYPYMRTALAQNAENGIETVYKTIYAGMATYYIFKNQHDSAIHYNKLYQNITDTIYSATLAGQVNELLSKYETEQKEQKIVLLKEQNTIKQLTINRKNVTISIIGGSFVIAILLGVLFYNRYRMRQESRLQEEILKQQQLSSRAVIAAEELERKRIAGDLHDGIGQMFSAVKMNLSGISDRIAIPEQDRDLLDRTLALVDESCKEIRVMSHQMMPNVLLKSGLAAAIRDFIDKIDERKLKITLETFGLKQPLAQNIESVLYRVVQESVNNVIKHAQASSLDIQLHKDDDGINVTIEDNGIGFALNKIDEDKGIGLKSIRARVAFLNGKVDYDTAPGKGTLVAIFIPNQAA